MPDLRPEKNVVDEPPPFLNTWPRVYRLVLLFLVTEIVLFFLFTRYYAPPAV